MISRYLPSLVVRVRGSCLRLLSISLCSAASLSPFFRLRFVVVFEIERERVGFLFGRSDLLIDASAHLQELVERHQPKAVLLEKANRKLDLSPLDQLRFVEACGELFGERQTVFLFATDRDHQLRSSTGVLFYLVDRGNFWRVFW
jgi:hypothetical protein